MPGNPSALTGTLTATAVAGVATFSNLTVTTPGSYYLSASAPGYVNTSSNLFVVAGVDQAEDITALRQTPAYDGTQWRKTTGVSSPSTAAMTTTETLILDGDMTNTGSNKVTVDGIRWTFPYTMRFQRIDYKCSISSLTSAPVISVYTSDDTTAPTNGTWTLRASYTPPHTRVFISAFSFATPVTCKGVWITLNDNGGPATCDWYAAHPIGQYVNANVSYVDVDTNAETTTESTLSVPFPAEKLSGARTVERALIVRNNTPTPLEIAPLVTSARYAGDTTVNYERWTLYDDKGVLLPLAFGLGAYESKYVRAVYTITAALNDLTGKHYARALFLNPTATTGWFRYIKTGTYQGYDLATGATSGTLATGGETYTDLSYSLPYAATVVITNDGASTVRFRASTALSGHTVSSAGTASEWDRMVMLTPTTVYFLSSASQAVKTVTLVTTGATSASLAATTTAFTLPTQTTGSKNVVARDATRMWICDGSTSDIRIYDIDIYGNVYSTITTVTNLSGLTIAAIAWDSVREELYVITAVSGGSRTVARYSTSGAFIASTTNSDRSTLEATGVGVMNGQVYVLYGGRYLWRYTVQTMASGSELYDKGANTGTGRMVLTAL
jgi:hypothetical protein